MSKSDNINIETDTFCETYKRALELLVNNYSYETAPRRLKIRECLNTRLVINNPYSNLFTNSYRDIPISYLKNELLLYFSARNDAEGFTKASKFWDKIKTEDNKINSAYGHLIFNQEYEIDTTKEENILIDSSQWAWAVQSLLADKDSRQAIIHFNRPIHQYAGNKDFVCTMYGIFHIRDNKLDFSIFMRSQDIRKGTQFDIPFFTILQQEMLNILKYYKYKDLEMGKYTHFCNSLHIYEPDFELASNMIKADWAPDSTPKIKTCPILHPDIISLSYNKNHEIYDDYITNDEFFNWLKS